MPIASVELQANTTSVSVALMHVTPVCVNCTEAIFDQYFLCVAEQAWHCHCLKCAVCGVSMDRQKSCYYRDGHILCKEDYYKQCRVTRCAGCNCSILSNELVMKIQHFAYHLPCFRCSICSLELRTGDRIGMRENGQVYCQYHQKQFSVDFNHSNMSCENGLRDFKNTTSVCAVEAAAAHQAEDISSSHPAGLNQHPLAYLPVSLQNSDYFGGSMEKKEPKIKGRRRKGLHALELANDEGGAVAVTNQSLDHLEPYRQLIASAAGSGASVIQHIPKQRSSSSLASSPSGTEDSGSGQANSNSTAGSHQQSHLHMLPQMPARTGSRSQRDSSSPADSIGQQQHNQRTKRMRTSFKHQQLRSMKQYFQINHNPDAKDLKQLAQKTGLTKRVLQVWFQNARAKYRRSLLKQDPNAVINGSPSEKSEITSPRMENEARSPCSFVNSELASLQDNVTGADLNHYPMSNSNGTNSQDTVTDFY